MARPREWWAWGALVAIALAVRVADLGSRPYQFDEGQIGYAAYLLSAHGDYHYMPVLHGPLNYQLSALSHLVFGTVDVANRIPAALAGTLLVGLAFCFLLSYVATLVGLAPIVGAFTAGLILEDAQFVDLSTKERHTLEELLEPLIQWIKVDRDAGTIKEIRPFYWNVRGVNEALGRGMYGQ